MSNDEIKNILIDFTKGKKDVFTLNFPPMSEKNREYVIFRLWALKMELELCEKYGRSQEEHMKAWHRHMQTVLEKAYGNIDENK